MAQLTPTETHAIKEAARTHAVAVEKLGLFAQMASDEELRHLLREAQRKMSRQYEELRSYGQSGQSAAGLGMDHGIATDMGESARWAGAPAGAVRGVPSTDQHPDARAAWNPPTQAGTLSDRVMVTDLLESCKHLATLCTWYAVECADRNLRRDFKQLTQEHIDLAYEAFRYMEKHGWYGLRSATNQQISGIAQQYRPVESNAMAGFAAGTPAGSRIGHSDWETASGHGFTPPARPAADDRPDERTSAADRDAPAPATSTRGGGRPSVASRTSPRDEG